MKSLCILMELNSPEYVWDETFSPPNGEWALSRQHPSGQKNSLPYHSALFSPHTHKYARHVPKEESQKKTQELELISFLFSWCLPNFRVLHFIVVQASKISFFPFSTANSNLNGSSCNLNNYAQYLTRSQSTVTFEDRVLYFISYDIQKFS